MAQPGREVMRYASTFLRDTSISATYCGHDNSIGRVLASPHLIRDRPTRGTVLL